MNKLGLMGLFAGVAALVYGAQKDSERNRDTLLMELAQGLYREDLPRCEKAALTLARDFGYQREIRNCLLSAIDDIRDQFGDAKGFALLRLVHSETRSREFSSIIQSASKKVRNLSREQEAAREQVVRDLSEFLHKSGLPQIDFGTGAAGIKRVAAAATGTRMTPEQFLKRYEQNAGQDNLPAYRAS